MMGKVGQTITQTCWFISGILDRTRENGIVLNVERGPHERSHYVPLPLALWSWYAQA